MSQKDFRLKLCNCDKEKSSLKSSFFTLFINGGVNMKCLCQTAIIFLAVYMAVNYRMEWLWLILLVVLG